MSEFMFSIFGSLIDKFLMKGDKKKIEQQCQNVRGNKDCNITNNITNNYNNQNAEEYFKRENEKQRKEEKLFYKVLSE